MGAKGKDIRVTNYDIIEILEDPDFYQHFLRRFKMACEQYAAQRLRPTMNNWYGVYKDRPETLYRDIIDDLKTMLGRQQSSAAILPATRSLQGVTLKAVGDWICEKENTIPPLEIFPNVMHTYPIPFEKYYVKKVRYAKENKD